MGVDRLEDDGRYDWLQLRLSRIGLYDLLPEGLFHQSSPGNRQHSAAEMAAASKLDKKKKIQSVNSFNPGAPVLPATHTTGSSRRKITGRDRWQYAERLFFFRLATSQSASCQSRRHAGFAACRMLAGSPVTSDLMQDCLEILLHEQVRISTYRPGTSFADTEPAGLGSAMLGNDLVCGQSFDEDYPCLLYTHRPIAAYITGIVYSRGEQELLLQVFDNFFAPVDADIRIDLEIDPAKAVIRLSGEESPILGYSTTL